MPPEADVEVKSTLGQKVKVLRVDLGLTQGVLAERAHVSQGYLSQIENDEIDSVGSVMLRNIANALGVSYLVLVTDEPIDILVGINPVLADYLRDMGAPTQDALIALFRLND